MQRHMVPSPNPHAELEPFESIEAADPLPIPLPTFATSKDLDPAIANPWACLRQITNLEAQGRLILGPTRRSTQTGRTDMPAHHPPKRVSEATDPLLGSGRTSAVFLQAFR